MRRLFVDRLAPQRDAIEEAATWIARGGVVAIPTDTLYGLAVDPFSADAVARLFVVKGRADDRPLPLVAADLAQVLALGPLTAVGRRLAERYWPGPLTLLVAAPRALAPAVHAGTGKVGVRVPRDDVARAICAAARTPLTATSANVSGEPATADPGEVERALGARIDVLIDTGEAPGGAPSTIVDATVDPPALVRAGAISWDEIQRWLHSELNADPASRGASAPRSSA